MNRYRNPLLMAAMLAAAPCGAATITVNSTADTVANDGFCTLREAINSVNSNAASGGMSGECAAGDAPPTVDTIAFNIPGTDAGCSATTHVCTITPGTTLPEIENPVLIDGYTQPGTSANTLAVGDNAVLRIELDASNVNPALNFDKSPSGDSSGSTLRGMIVSNIPANGVICIANCASNLTIVGNFLGTDALGATNTAPNTTVYFETCSGPRIGGTAPADRNVIGGQVMLLICSDATVQGNYFGIDASGTAPLMPLAQYLLQLPDSSGTLIGGTTPGAGNIFGGWTASAINAGVDNALYQSGNNLIQGNLIGTDAAGSTVLTTGQVGIALGLAKGGTGNAIGGSTPGAGNLIGGARLYGIVISTDEPDVVVQGNSIGTDVSGHAALPNNAGIVVYFADTGSGLIGGTGPGEANRVAYNNAQGIVIAGGTGWAMLGNAIYGNGGIGISLGSATPAPNDDGDGDTGNNNLQNYPVIDDDVAIGPVTQATFSGSLNSTADTTFRVEFFANANCDPSGHGQGKVFVGFSDVTTSGNDAAFGPLALAVPRDRHVITATATDPDGNTSEFSACSTQDTIFSESYEGD